MNDAILNKINKISNNTLMQTLNIKYINVGKTYLIAKMPITQTVHQPFGFLHGGATVALAESVGSMLSYYIINNKKLYTLCIEIAANHINIKKDGIIFARADLLNKSKRFHFIQIKIFDIKKNIVSQCKMTNFIFSKK